MTASPPFGLLKTYDCGASAQPVPTRAARNIQWVTFMIVNLHWWLTSDRSSAAAILTPPAKPCRTGAPRACVASGGGKISRPSGDSPGASDRRNERHLAEGDRGVAGRDRRP